MCRLKYIVSTCAQGYRHNERAPQGCDLVWCELFSNFAHDLQQHALQAPWVPAPVCPTLYPACSNLGCSCWPYCSTTTWQGYLLHMSCQHQYVQLLVQSDDHQSVLPAWPDRLPSPYGSLSATDFPLKTSRSLFTGPAPSCRTSLTKFGSTPSSTFCSLFIPLNLVLSSISVDQIVVTSDRNPLSSHVPLEQLS